MMRWISGLLLTLIFITPLDAKTRKIPAGYQTDRYPSQDMGTGKQFSRPFIEAAKKSTPSVVYIQAEGVSDGQQDPFEFFNDDFFNKFFGAPPSRRRAPQPQVSQGSGFIVSPDGYILTNYHVVRGAQKITVLLHNGVKREVSATFIGGDDRTDVAMIKLDDEIDGGFPYLELGNSDDVEVGEWVLAVGNPFQLEATVTAGIISAKGRQNLQITDLEDFLQTDAPINPGNSGGPLIDLDGNVIGMNTAIVSRSGGYMGIGFAIPSNMLKNIKEQLIEKGSVSRGFLGVSLQPIDRDLAEAFNLKKAEGALVVDVVDGSAADKAGLRQGDIITHVNGNEVKNPANLRNDLMLLKPNTKVMLTVNRNGQILSIPVILGTYGESTYSSSTTSSKTLGLTVDNLTKEHIQSYGLQASEKGVLIMDVHHNSPAARIGLKPGMIVMAVNHKEVNNVKDFNEAVEGIGPNQRILLLVKQGSMVRFYSLKTAK
ncbi:Do family serine endopeptidase [Simkania sp.]|uniref:Do family serine endopeptidase n=1 Tax=Simkania sp. TaxID=34094 RepID=UPI003B52F73C